MTREPHRDEGFTLTELMVVVLIMGILMAIAIPTFLSSKDGAYDASAKSDARNALLAAESFYDGNGYFPMAGIGPDGSLDANLPWGLGPGQVQITGDLATIDGTVYDVAMISALSQSGNCYYVAAMWSGNSPTIGYAITTGGRADPWTYSVDPLQGSASGHTILTASAFSAAGGTAPSYQSW